VTLLLGCSSSSSTSPPGTDTPATLADAFAQAFCTAQATCSGTTVTTPDGGAVTGTTDAGTTTGGAKSSCLDRARLGANQQLALVSTAFGEGLLTINSVASSDCLTVYKQLGCTVLANQSVPDIQAALDQPACAGIFTGYIPVGERCDMSAECISGSFCLSQGTGQPATAIAGSGTLGVCYAYQAAGDACNDDNDCLPPLLCNPSTLLCQ
jgi:hypothetical protein